MWHMPRPVRRSCNWSSIEVAGFIPFQSRFFSVGVDKSRCCLHADGGLIAAYAAIGKENSGDSNLPSQRNIKASTLPLFK